MSQATATPDVIEFAIDGMHCASCVAHVEKGLAKVDGVASANVNLASGRAQVTLSSDKVTKEALFAAVSKTGYNPHALDSTLSTAAAESDASQLKRELLVAVVFAVPLMIIAMLPMVPGMEAKMAQLLPPIGWGTLELLLVLPVQFYSGRRFYRLGFKEFKHLAPGMDSLVLLGSNAAFFYSLAALTVPQLFPANTAHTYFDAAGMIITLILFGRYLEAIAKGRASAAIRQLIQLQPSTAQVKRGAQWLEQPIESISLGDIVAVRPGERMPVDGDVLNGQSSVNEAMVSGESMPVNKKTGDNVLAGTINGTGRLELSATGIGSQTLLAKITHMVEEAQSHKPAIQATADKVAGVFVPVVMTISLITFVSWLSFATESNLAFAFVTSVAVLLIACPCAMGLAAPVAIMVATGQAAANGILFRKGAALEHLAAVDTFVFDKTGTLTQGQPQLTDFTVVQGADQQQLLGWLASAESASEHPLAKAVVDAAKQQQLTLASADNFSAHSGRGIEATIEQQLIQAGSAAFMQLCEVDISPLETTTATLSRAAKTLIYLAVDGKVAAVSGIADTLRPESADTIRALHQAGKETLMLTGDSPAVANAIAEQLGIDKVIAGVLPDEKAAEIKRLQQQNRRIAFIGDGLNDAPALAQADIGIAIGSGTDIAIESAGVVLMHSDLSRVVDAMILAKRTLTTIRTNFAWAYGYNIILIPLAAGVFYSWTGWLLNPMVAAGAMSLSSLFVLANSLRLKRTKLGSL